MAEILAPCGSSEALGAALRCGADAVYLGGENFSARQNAANFNNDELKKAVYECHKRGVKLYLAINTLITDEQLEQCIDAVKNACELGVDGLITQDLALAEIVKVCCPKMEIHSSTQMTIHTKRGAEVAKSLGFSRVVLSRELPFEIIADIAAMPIETEVFVHGALCMSVSGQCFMSAVIGSRSANRGLCAQPCRLPMTAVKGKEEYALSLKDMCEIDHVKELVSAGVDSLKIEGRMKRPEYVAAAVNAYKKAVNGEHYDISLLESVFSRSGFTDGYITNKKGSEMFGIRTKEDVTAAAKALPKLHELYRHEEKRSGIKIHCIVKKDCPMIVTAEDENGIGVNAAGDVPQVAVNRACDIDMLKKQFSKLGDTIYSLHEFSAEIDDGLAVSASKLNELRRQLVQKLDDKRAEDNSKAVSFDQNNLIFDFPMRKKPAEPKIRVSVTELNQLDCIDFSQVEMIVIPLVLVRQAVEKGFPKEKIMVSMPRFTFDEQSDFKILKNAHKYGIDNLLCTNIAHISMGKELGMIIHTDFGFNTANSLALKQLKEMGVADAICSFELKASQINRLAGFIPVGIIAYGRLALMLTANCPVNKSAGCEKCQKRLWDRTGREFPVKCNKKQGYVEILNSEILSLADKRDDFAVDFIRLDFYEESAQRVKEVVDAYHNGCNLNIDRITRGLYYRGVI